MARAALERPAGTTRSRFGLAPVIALLKRLRGDLPLIGIVVGVVLVTSFVFAAIPRLYNGIADDGLAYAVDHAKPFLRNIQMARADRLDPGNGGDLYSTIDTEGAKFQDSLAPSIQKIITGRSFIYDSPRYKFLDLPGASPWPSPRYFTLRQGEDIESRVTLLDGRLPQPTDETAPNPFDTDQTDARVFELAISPETARQLGAKIGDRFWVAPDPSDSIVRRFPVRGLQYIVCEIVGFIDVNDVNDPWWFNDVRLDRAIEYDDGNRTHIYATGLMAKDAYPDLLNVVAPMPVNYMWRYFTDSARFNAGDLDQLAADVRRLDAEYQGTGLAPPTDTTVRTGLTAIFKQYLSQRDLTEAILSLASIGLLAVALAVIGLVAALIAERRRDQTALIRGRGGSGGQILAAQLTEGLLLGLPAAVVGLLLASLLVGDRSSVLSPLAAVAIAVVTALLLVFFVWPMARRPLQAVQRADVVLTRVSLRRVVAEAGIIAITLAGVYLIRRRGLSADSSAQSVGGFDLYLAAVPILLGLAAGLLALRIYPLPVRFLAWIASLRRDLVLSLGFRRVARQPSINSAPLLVLLLAVALGVFSSVLLFTIDEGQVKTSWQTVGAPYRVDSNTDAPLYRKVDMTAAGSVEAVAPAFYKEGFSIVSQTPVFGLVDLLAVDTVEYSAVNQGTPMAPDFPNIMLVEEFDSGIGTPSNPIPAIVSRTWTFNQAVKPGDTFALNIDQDEVSFVVAQVRDSFPGVSGERSFVIASLGAMLAYSDPPPIQVNRLYVRAPDGAVAELRQTLQSQTVSAHLTARIEEYNAVHKSPLISGTSRGFRVGMLIAAAYSALAVAVALALTARSRSRDLAFLRTLGLSDRQVLGLIVVEQAPPVAVALIVGVALGIVTVRLIEPGLDLTAFTGEGVPAPMLVDYGAITILAIGLVVVVAITIAVVSNAAQRANLGSALRLGDE